MHKLLYLLFPAVLLLSHCTEDLEMAPAFVTVEDLDLVTPGLSGSTSDITEVWAFANEQFVGSFRLPARIPIFFAGETNLSFQAGVRRNGISATPEIYDFYAPATRTIELTPGETIDLGRLEINYRDDVQFGFIEDFEPETERVFTTRLSGTEELNAQSTVVRSGLASGKFTLTEDSPLLELATNKQLTGLFQARPYVWLEVDFLSEAPVAWGVIGQQNNMEVRPFDPTFLPRSTWTKIYFDMSEVVAVSQLDELEVFLSGILLSENPEAEVYLDNIRLLYF